MKAFLYILRLQSGGLYIGCTKDLETRYKDHRNGRACRTTRIDPWDFPTVRFQEKPINFEESEIDVEFVRVRLGIVGDHAEMRRSLEMGAMLAPSQAPVLNLGETDTGKELFARFLHALSGRPWEIFIAVNCAAIPEDLVESLLYRRRRT